MFDLVLDLLDLVEDGTVWVSDDGDGNDVSANTTGTAKVSLLWDVDV